jgi:hypothetical protein
MNIAENSRKNILNKVQDKNWDDDFKNLVFKFSDVPVDKITVGTYNPDIQILESIDVDTQTDKITNFSRHFLNLLKYKELYKLFMSFDVYAKYKNIINSTRQTLGPYLKQRFGLSQKPSNAFIKMYEIQIEADLIPEKPDDLLTFHLAEAPGNFITAIMHRFKTLNPNGTHHWFASSLNPKYSNEALPDSYGYIQRHPDRWLFGKDDTGDILNMANSLDYKRILEKYKIEKKIDKIQLITGDLGVSMLNKWENEDEEVKFFQKLELAQAIGTIICSDEGTDCVTKHFIPYLPSRPITKKSIGYFITLMYIYRLHFEEFEVIKPFTSSHTGLEFYITCKNFRRPKNISIENLITAFDKFELNGSFFEISKIPSQFIDEIDSFMKNLIEYYTETIERIILMASTPSIDQIERGDAATRRPLHDDYYDDPRRLF